MATTKTQEQIDADFAAAVKTAEQLTDCALCRATIIVLLGVISRNQESLERDTYLSAFRRAAGVPADQAATMHVAKAALAFALRTFLDLNDRNPALFVNVLGRALAAEGVRAALGVTEVDDDVEVPTGGRKH